MPVSHKRYRYCVSHHKPTEPCYRVKPVRIIAITVICNPTYKNTGRSPTSWPDPPLVSKDLLKEEWSVLPFYRALQGLIDSFCDICSAQTDNNERSCLWSLVKGLPLCSQNRWAQMSTNTGRKGRIYSVWGLQSLQYWKIHLKADLNQRVCLH